MHVDHLQRRNAVYHKSRTQSLYSFIGFSSAVEFLGTVIVNLCILCIQEIYAKDKWKTVLKLVRVTKRWGGIENVFTMNVHF